MIELGSVLVGSQNYGLNGPDSDEDFKILYCPTFYDLYKNHKVGNGDMAEWYDKDHNSPMDCRNFDKLIHICNPNILEMIFSSNRKIVSEDLSDYFDKARNLFSSTPYLALHWKEFCSAVQGLCFNSLTRYGNNAKAVSRSWYLMNLVNYVNQNGFTMNENTWRNNNYSTCARNIRFGDFSQESLDSFSKGIQNFFSTHKEELANNANEWCKNHPKEIVHAQVLADELSLFMMYEVVLPTVMMIM